MLIVNYYFLLRFLKKKVKSPAWMAEVDITSSYGVCERDIRRVNSASMQGMNVSPGFK